MFHVLYFTACSHSWFPAVLHEHKSNCICIYTAARHYKQTKCVSICHSHAVESYRAVCESYLDTSDCRALRQLLQDPRLCWLRVMLMLKLRLWCLTTGTLSGWAALRSSSGAAEAGELLSLWPPLPHWKCMHTHTWQTLENIIFKHILPTLVHKKCFTKLSY